MNNKRNTQYADECVGIVRNRFNSIYNVNLEKTPEFSIFDLKDKYNKFSCEVKQRNIRFGNYPTLIIGFNKYEKARQYIQRGYRPFFIWYLLDGIYFYEYKNDIFKRENNGYGRDIININIDKIKKLE